MTQCHSTSSGRNSSQATPLCHNHWKRIFAHTRKGARHPIGAKMQDAALSICRFVSSPSGRVFSGATNVTWSSSRSQ
ncbi:hypothetical protein T05_16499 [Trichinella murrelli]|uniref:Uncharacterized protein n=1 Tax=Trichinella murrelli TaxID=144512 RepID=A0A0V0TE39_9BILA|nr:hypothetical protein T05_16499 [Trichinella murrelli]